MAAEERLDGKFLLSSSDDAVPAAYMAWLYKSLLEVEASWRDLKQTIELRPVYHRKEERTEATPRSRAILKALGVDEPPIVLDLDTTSSVRVRRDPGGAHARGRARLLRVTSGKCAAARSEYGRSSPLGKSSHGSRSLRTRRPWVSRPRTTSIPRRMRSSSDRLTRPTRSTRISRSMDTICETFATESFASPVCPAPSTTFPGARAQRRLLVSGTTTVVASRLALKASPCTTTTGRRKPGPEPTGSGNSAQ